MTQDDLKIVRGINFCTNSSLLPKLKKLAILKTTTIGELYVNAMNDGINLIELLKEFDDSVVESGWTSTTTFNGTPKWDL